MTGKMLRGKLADAAKTAAQKTAEARERRSAEAPARAEQRGAQRQVAAEAREQRTVEREDARIEAEHYEAEVNKGAISIRVFNATLNKRWRAGWKLSHMFEQHGNTIIVWERRPRGVRP